MISDVKGGRHASVVTEVKRTKQAGRKAYSVVDWREAGCGLVETLGSSGRQCTGPTTSPHSQRGHYSSPHPPPPESLPSRKRRRTVVCTTLHAPQRQGPLVQALSPSLSQPWYNSKNGARSFWRNSSNRMPIL